MVQSHILSVPLAVKYGANESLFLSNICWWIEKNRANDRHFHEGRYWTYNSVTGFTELFPYFTANQIQYLIDKLRKKNILQVGNFNKIGYDRTNWYSVSDEVMNIYLGKATEEEGVPAPETGPEDEPDPAAEISPPGQDETPCPDSEPAPPEPSPILPNGKMHLGNFMNPFYQTGKWIHEKSMIDSGNFQDRFGKIHEPIPAIKPVNKPAAAGKTEKPPSSSGPPKTAAAALQKEFHKIDPFLIFDEAFYSRVLVFLQTNSLDSRYLIWLYEECLAKNPASLRNLYYSLFFKPDILARFLETRKKTRDPPPKVNIACPVCGREHEQKESCPECGLALEDRTSGETIAKQKRLYALSPEDRKTYEAALVGLASDFGARQSANPGLIQELLQKKLILEEKYGLLPQSGAE
jgi:hypothetical protein